MKKRTLMLSAIIFSVAPVVFGNGPERSPGITERLADTSASQRECSLKGARQIPKVVAEQGREKDGIMSSSTSSAIGK